jgi:hypothetical protein
MITNADYIFVERNPDETSYVKLTGESPWNGTVFQYGKLALHENIEADFMELSFTYNVIESPLRKEMLEEDVNFKNYIGEVLGHIIDDAVNTGEYQIGTRDNKSTSPTRDTTSGANLKESDNE